MVRQVKNKVVPAPNQAPRHEVALGE